MLLAGGLLIAAWPNVAGSGAKVDAAAPSDGIVYYLAGTVNAAGSSEDIGWGAGNGSVQGLLESTWVDDEDKSEFDWADGYHEFVFDAVAGDMFKLVVNGSGWGSPWWMKFEEMFLNTSYFEPAESDGNVQVKETGTYTLRFTHQYQSSSGTDKPWNIHVTGTVAEVFHTVTVMNGEETIATATVADGSTYSPEQVFVEDHVLEGFYANPELTTPYDSTLPITEDTVIYANYVACTSTDYWVYVETYVDDPLDNVYYWNSDTGFDVPWAGEGVQIAEPLALTPATPEGKAIYGIEIKVEYQADKIIFHNGEGGDANQTIDLDLPSEPTVYWVGEGAGTTGKIDASIFEDNDSWVEALAFLDYWSTIRIDNDVYEGTTYQNSICYLLTDIEAWNELNGLYTRLTPEAKALVNPVDDGEATVLETMEYLANAHAEPAVGPAASAFFSEPGNVAGIAAGTLILVSILGFSVFYFVRRRKHASN